MTTANAAAPQLTEQQIPKPTGFRILVAIPDIKEATEGGIIKPDSVLKSEEVSTMVVRVVDMGPDAYQDKERFPNGPYCQIGDYVLIRAYSGTRFKIHDREFFRVINDDSVEAVVEDPTGYSRI